MTGCFLGVYCLCWPLLYELSTHSRRASKNRRLASAKHEASSSLVYGKPESVCSRGYMSICANHVCKFHPTSVRWTESFLVVHCILDYITHGLSAKFARQPPWGLPSCVAVWKDACVELPAYCCWTWSDILETQFAARNTRQLSTWHIFQYTYWRQGGSPRVLARFVHPQFDCRGTLPNWRAFVRRECHKSRSCTQEAGGAQRTPPLQQPWLLGRSRTQKIRATSRGSTCEQWSALWKLYGEAGLEWPLELFTRVRAPRARRRHFPRGTRSTWRTGNRDRQWGAEEKSQYAATRDTCKCAPAYSALHLQVATMTGNRANRHSLPENTSHYTLHIFKSFSSVLHHEHFKTHTFYWSPGRT